MPSETKMTITSHRTIDCSDGAVDTITLQINPETIEFSWQVQDDNSAEDSDRATGDSAPPPPPPKYQNAGLKIDSIIDATGVLFVNNENKASGITLDEGGPSVAPYLKKLKQVCLNYDNEIHGQSYLKVVWGKALLSSSNKEDSMEGMFKGILKNLSVTFSLFSSTGNPVRANFTIELDGITNPETRDSGNSPDLSHIIDVKYGDNLPKLCKDIYGSPEFFLQVAKINNLPSIYAIEPGMQLLFPPLEKSSR
jgi:hypothetical protein